MILRVGTPADSSPLMISLMISGEEQQAGAPDGLILIPTMSAGVTNFAQAAALLVSPVSSFIPRSSITLITGCETRLFTIERESNSSITRPGYKPGMRSGEGLASKGS